MRYILGNFKANKTRSEMKVWIDEFNSLYVPHPQVTVGLFPQTVHLDFIRQSLRTSEGVIIGSQTLSSHESGSFTGEVTAQALSGIVSHSIIGHSERRKVFGETNDTLFEKTKLAKKHSIEPIYCVRDEHDPIPEGVTFIAYEPITAIGTGKNEPPELTCAVKKKIKLTSSSIFIYGGSVNATNASEYLKTGEIDGFLIGKITLDSHDFLAVVEAAKTT